MRVLKDIKRVIRLGLLGIVFCFVTTMTRGSASALSGGQSVGIQFTFNASLSVTFSSSELVIDNLTPGTYSKSNTISIDVQTNNRNGYTLTAEVGDSETPAYANSSLVNTISSTAFTSLSTSDNLTLSAFSPNSWGYTTATSVDSSSTYSGLLYNATTILNQTVDVNGNSTGKFKGTNLTNFTIGANAGVDQASGQYTNTISFAVVPNVSTDITIDSLQYMQNFPELTSDQVASVLSSMTPGQAYELKDRRDEESYHIAKLSDGKIWLLDNLRLDLSTTKNLTPADTNIATDWTAPTEITTWANTYNAPKINTASKDTTQSYGSGDGKIGVYYNYCAATAGTYCYGEGAGTGDATYDICPVGWRMPTGGASGEYQALYLAYGSNVTNFKNALRTPLSSYFSDGSASVQGSRGYFWSSTYNSDNNMHYLITGLSYVTPQSNDSRYYGISVRCVLDGTIEYSMSFDKNTNDTVTSMPSSQSGTMGNGGNLTLPSNTPSRSGYAFLGWCTTQPTVSNGVDSCSGTTYQPDQTYFIDYNQARIDVTFYAMWEARHTVTISLTGNATGVTIDGETYTSTASLAAGSYTISGSYTSGYEFSSWATSGSVSVASTSSASTTLTVSGTGTLTLNGKESLPSLAMQNVTPATCPTTATRVYDNRDNSIYTIQKLADNRCWLLDNLALDLTNSTVLNALSTSNTNASAASLTSLRSGNRVAGDQYATAGVANWTSSYSFSAPLIATSGSGNKGDWTKDTLQSYGSGSGKIGVYYNYCAASAGSYCYGDGTSYGSPSGNATEDICPAGWRMPTGGSSGEYQALYTAYSSNATNFKNALRTPLSGHFYYSSADGQGSFSYFWSSTYGNSYGMYGLYVSSSNVGPQNGPYRDYGYSVRCVLDQVNSIADVRMMQKFGELDSSTKTAVVNSMTEGQQYTLKDVRDGKSYTVAKIGGFIWMTKNLDLAGGTTLTSADSNVTSDYTLPTSSTSGFSDEAVAYVYNSNSTTCGNNSPCYSYYSYVAATAGTNPTSAVADYDICPKGWRLPWRTIFNTLKSTYSTGATLTASPFYGTYAGYYYDSSFRDGGSRGYYWSSSSYNASMAYYLYFNSSSADTGIDGKRVGISIRCMAN